MKKITILIPALNEERTIVKVIKQIPKKILGLKTQILVIDDGSTDNTAKLAKRAGASVISHSKNRGVGKAFQTGLEKTIKLKTDIMVNIDADNQFNPNDIYKLILPIVKHKADFVSADRFTDKKNHQRKKPRNMPTVKYFGNLIMASLISFLAKQKFNDVSCGFRAYNKKALSSLNLMGEFTYTQESFLDLAIKGLQIKTIPIEVVYFPNRKSRITHNLLYYIYKTLKIIIRSFRDYKPMLFFIYLSTVPALISLFSGIFLAHYYLTTGQFTPYKSLGFVFIYFSTITFILLLTGFLADMFIRLRMNQERILRSMKEKKIYKLQ